MCRQLVSIISSIPPYAPHPPLPTPPLSFAVRRLDLDLLLHQTLNSRLDLGNMPLTMDSLSDNHSQFISTLSLGIGDSGLSPLYCFFHIEAVKIYRPGWGMFVVLYFISYFPLWLYGEDVKGDSPLKIQSLA